MANIKGNNVFTVDLNFLPQVSFLFCYFTLCFECVTSHFVSYCYIQMPSYDKKNIRNRNLLPVPLRKKKSETFVYLKTLISNLKKIIFQICQKTRMYIIHPRLLKPYLPFYVRQTSLKFPLPSLIYAPIILCSK